MDRRRWAMRPVRTLTLATALVAVASAAAPVFAADFEMTVGIGTTEAEIASLTLDDALAFYRRYYHAGNAILSIAGNFDLKTTRDLISELFRDQPSGEEVSSHFFDQVDYRSAGPVTVQRVLRTQLRETLRLIRAFQIAPSPVQQPVGLLGIIDEPDPTGATGNQAHVKNPRKDNQPEDPKKKMTPKKKQVQDFG